MVVPCIIDTETSHHVGDAHFPVSEDGAKSGGVHTKAHQCTQMHTKVHQGPLLCTDVHSEVDVSVPQCISVWVCAQSTTPQCSSPNPLGG